VYLIGKKEPGLASYLSSVISLIALLLLIVPGIEIMQGNTVRLDIPWISAINLTFGLYLDGISLVVAGIILGLGSLVSIYSQGYMSGKEGQGSYYANLLFFLGGMLGVALATNLLQFMLFWEIMVIPSYFLVLYWGTPGKSIPTALNYFIFTHVGSLIMMGGMGLSLIFTGSLELSALATIIAQNQLLGQITVIALLVGFLVKMAAFPVHTWLPPTHAEAPTPISALLSGVMVKMGAYAIVRILLASFIPIMIDLSLILGGLAILTMIYGGIMALGQKDIKLLLAYSSISQLGYILLGLVSATQIGIAGSMLHVLNHAIAKGMLFLCAGVFMHQAHTRDLDKLSGIAKKLPITSIALLIGALSLSGIPPFGGFFSEWAIFAGGFSNPALVFLMFAAIGGAVLTFGYYLRLAYIVIFGSPVESLGEVEKPPLSMTGPLIILSIGAVVFGIFCVPILNVIATSIASFGGI
jgi:proton-translocating NADH-quinone oxidoreductase chain M